MNDSSTGGVLVPTSTAPLDDDALDQVIQTTLRKITGVDGTLVRPRWPVHVPVLPAVGVDWISFGITEVEGSDTPNIMHVGAGDGYDVMTNSEQLTLIVSCYGPNGLGIARRLRDGLALPQNSEELKSGAGLVVAGMTPIVAAPALLNESWQRKREFRILLRRSDAREYPILNLLSAEGSVDSETTHDEFTVEN